MTENPQTTFEQLCAFVQDRMEKTGVPGVAIGVLYGDETYTAGFGVTNVDHPLPVTSETLFQIGSITKTFTCLAVMRLVEQGQLDLHVPVRTYLPEFKVADEATSARVTIGHLLTHMSGWDGDLFEDTGAGRDAMALYMHKMADREQLAPLGEVWSYNNSGFCLCGYLIEQITGQSYEKAMQELVFEPLGLERCLFDPGDVITHRFAVGHHASPSSAQVLRPWPLPRYAYAAGGIATDVHELLCYARFQMGDGSVAGKEGDERVEVLQAETLAAMHSPQANRHGETEQIGLSWFVDDVAGTRQISHGGGTLGQISLLALFPEHVHAAGRPDQRRRGRRDHGRRAPLGRRALPGAASPQARAHRGIPGGPGGFCRFLCPPLRRRRAGHAERAAGRADGFQAGLSLPGQPHPAPAAALRPGAVRAGSPARGRRRL